MGEKMEKILKKPKLMIVIVLVLTVVFVWQIPNVKFNNNLEVFLPENNPVKKADQKIEDVFGGSSMMVLAIKNKKASILNNDSIKLVRDLTQKIKDIENIDSVESITNTDFIEGIDGGMEVSKLVPENIQTANLTSTLKRKLFSWQDMYRNNFYSNDLKSTQISIQLKDGITVDKQSEVYFALEDIIDNVKEEGYQFYLAGDPSVSVLLDNNMKGDLARLIPFVILMVIFALYISFKRAGGIILPLLVVLISTIWTVGLMVLLGIELTLLAVVIPVLLIGVGSAYGIHIISHYYDQLLEKNNGDFDQENHRQLIISTVKKIARPVFWTGVTTMVGFGSLTASNIVPMKEFGIFTAIGVAFAVILAITLIPSILLLRDKKITYTDKEDDETNRINKIILGIYHFFTKDQMRLLVFSLIIVLIFGYGATKINTGTNFINFFKEDTEIRKANSFINNNFGGSNFLTVMVSGEKASSLTEPDILKEIDNLDNYLTSNYKNVGKVISFTDLLKRMNQVMHYPDQSSAAKDVIDQDNEEIEETTSDFGDETTSSFGKETISSFSEENTSSFGDETTSNFGEETTSSFGEEKNDNNLESEQGSLKAPSTEKLSEKELIVLLNKAILKADKLDLSGSELIEAVSRELNYKGAAYDEIPYDPKKYNLENKAKLQRLISQYLLLYSGGMKGLINDSLEPSKAQMTVQLKNGNSTFTKKIRDEVITYAEDNFPEGYEIEIAGAAAMGYSISDLISEAQFKSIILALILVFVIVAYDYRSIIAGFYGIIVLAFSLIINFGIMGYAGIKMNVATAMISSVSIGIGIDYVIHFLSAYNDERKKTDDLEVVNRNVLLSTGKAIIFNAFSVTLGFLVMIFSNFVPLQQFGVLVSVIMLTSAGASLTILPALLNVFKPEFIKK